MISKHSSIHHFPFAHTFSIVARDPEMGHFGVAVQSHWFSVGSVVAYAEAGVGAVATQSMVEPSYGPLGLELMRAGIPAPKALASLLQADDGEALRQVAMVDKSGQAAAHTGSRCIDYAGHIAGEGFSVQANMMSNSTIWPEMANAYQAAFQSFRGNFAERLLLTLEAAQAAGGDIRGQQSATILIVAAESSGKPWEDRIMELHVEDHPQPLVELRRLVGLHRAYSYMNQGDAMMVEGRVDEALRLYSAAAKMAPSIAELPFWQAVTLTGNGRIDEAKPIFRRVFQMDPNLVQMVQSLPKSGLLPDDPEIMKQILLESIIRA